MLDLKKRHMEAAQTLTAGDWLKFTTWTLPLPYILVDKSRPAFRPVILCSGICSLYKSRSSIGLKFLRIIIIGEKIDPVIQTHGVSKCIVNINFFTGSDTHKHRDTHTHMDFALIL